MPLPDLETMKFHPTVEAVVDTLCERTQNNNRHFFRVLVNYNFCKVASMMRTEVATPDGRKVPTNMYAINLAASGFGKGYSTNILEDEVIDLFRERFLQRTFEVQAEEHIRKIAAKRAARRGTATDDEEVRAVKEFEGLGPLLFSFDSGTTPAIKQMRHKLLMADAGSMNFECDEIGSNLINQTDVLNVFLELYDVGKTKEKLVKSSAENARNEQIHGRTPCNMMLFGTPAKLLDGGKTEDELREFLTTGYGRRCIFGYSTFASHGTEMTPEEVYDMMTSTQSSQTLDDVRAQLGALADPINFGKEVMVSRDIMLLLIEYKIKCERKASKLPEHEEIRKAELSHRYFKALKIAGTYAFIDQTPDLEEEQLFNAIALVEESGKGLDSLLKRDSNYVRLAQFIAGTPEELTHADLMEHLPYYKGNNTQKQEMLTLATAWGYKNNIVIKKSFVEGIEFISGDSLQETNLQEMRLAVSEDIAYDYDNQLVAWDDLEMLGQNDDFHWINHFTTNGHRSDENIIPGFNMIVLDVDNDVSLHTAQFLLKDYKYIMYTTKRHTEEDNRFRIILPTNFELKLDKEDFKDFMRNVYEGLPFKSDEQTGQRARKWLSNAGEVITNDGQLFDVLPYIPKTSKNEERAKSAVDLQNLSNLERWFMQNTGKGNRSNQLIKYALMLVDAGGDFDQVKDCVEALNEKLQDPIPEIELASTIMITVAKAITARPQA